MNNIAIFASGAGTNAQRIIEYFKSHPDICVDLVLSNKSDAGVLNRAASLNIPTMVFNRQQFYYNNEILNILINRKINLIVLAGFLWLVPQNITDSYGGKIINIHPALLPKYGGKGMYGMKVHRTVVENKENETGITIHYVNGEYDEGDIIFQARCNINRNDTPETVAKKVHELEYKHYPAVIEKLIHPE